MAVLEGVRGIEVTVCADRQALQEYDDDEPEGVSAEVEGYDKATKTASKYIESITGKVFYIKLEISKAFKFDSPIISFHVFVDGMKVRSKHCGKKHVPLAMNVKGVKNELDNGQTFMMPFKFSDIITSMDDSKLATIKEDATRLSVVGEIMVKVYRKSEPRLSSAGQRSRVKLAVDTSIPVHEKALKGRAMSHGTVLGAAQPTGASLRFLSSYIDGADYPIAIYRFKYRSKVAESLESLLILERTPEPSPSPSPAPISNGASGPFDLESLDATQKTKLQEFLGNLLGNGGQPNGEKKIKREREETDSKTNKRPKRGERVEVDLIGDDSD
ncbi:uncharacterized protein Bfra_008978 [Botrytis fragariae]|uniref:DUF7918 domain-containing protein n=1 Tax=Botrytis fragariae TaxID=1964551 RepID=A0A8H6EH39_9HELO|nr:uncharacterized protein Bfra_008978 [Botrytis fragariae]KAF5871951.1 hypothetical protein Bfra_008978 [Botrytis fragariae]